MLSQQGHYDWGLRALKAVLAVAGQAIQRSYGRVAVSEDVVLSRVLRDLNLPKLVDTDHEMFEGILRDIFPIPAHPNFQKDKPLLSVSNVTEAANVPFHYVIHMLCLNCSLILFRS